MSSILKALEKVDESQRSRRPAGTGGLPKARARRPAWMIPVCTLGGAAIATLATYALMGGFSHKTAQPAKGEVAVTATPVAAAPAKAAPVARLDAKEVVTEQRSAAAATAAATKAATKPQIPAKLAARQLAQPSVAAKAPVVAQPAPMQQPVVQPAPVVAASAPAAPVAAQKSRPELRVTGIAWQNSSESSFAMVNGSPMRQGNVVNGYKIEQIYEDSVRFSSSKGSSLVVPLGAGEE